MDPKKKKLLVADDNQNFSQLMCCLFEEHFEVFAAADGEEALRLIAERRPDVILTDVMMPGLSGIELVRALNAGDGPRIPVLVLTGSHFNQEIEQLFSQEGRVAGFQSKTTPLQEIFAKVLEILGQPEAG
ncbi:MAG: response regulator [Elusimicrobia bacterium]|nr:response regulator [Elusimicrobiota bacterium]